MDQAYTKSLGEVPEERHPMNIQAITAIMQAAFCGGLFVSIALIYERKHATYKFLPSLCAFGLAALFGMQWLSIILDMASTGIWPEVSVYNTLIFGILFALVLRAKGNVSKIFEVKKTNEGP